MSAVPVFFLKNHSSSDLHRVGDVALLPSVSKRPEFKTKDEFAKWCHDISTEHCFYVLSEPEQPTLRSSRENPVRWLYGIVADYDGAASAVQAALTTLKFAAGRAPAWVTDTYSGKARLLWLFEYRIPIFTPDVFHRFMAAMTKELGLKKLLPGLDELALTNPATPYELGTNWRQPWGDTRLPQSVVLTALHDASAKAKWLADGPEIPLDAVAAEVERRWPNRWLGSITEGARGIRFWDPKADNPTGCTIRKTGAQAFTGEGRFLTWREILGEDFVKQYRQNRIGGAIEGTYFDGRVFWQRDAEDKWRNFNAEAIKRRLNASHGLSSETKKGVASEVALAVTTIEDLRSVDGAFPCFYLQETIVRDGTSSYLNISRVKVVFGAGQKRAWGEGFSRMAAYLNGLFDDQQLSVFLSWLSHFYVNAARGKPRKGHAMFIAGPVSAGNTFLCQRVIGGLMGGFEEATNFVLGNTTFNEQLAYAPVWAIDDAVAAADPRRHAVYSQVVKKTVANPKMPFHPKFGKEVSHYFHGRVVVTLNNDAESIQMLPQVEHSILDKVDLLSARDPGISFVGLEDAVTAELPAFADYLMSYEIPETLKTRPSEVARFGHDSWHHPELLQTAKQASNAAGLLELLEMWRTYYFRKFEKPCWEGIASELMVELYATEGLNKLIEKTVTSRVGLGKDMRKLVNMGLTWLVEIPRTATRSQGYRISPPEKK